MLYVNAADRKSVMSAQTSSFHLTKALKILTAPVVLTIKVSERRPGAVGDTGCSFAKSLAGRLSEIFPICL